MPQPFRFLDLPLELRYIIYEFTYAQDQQSIFLPTDTTEPTIILKSARPRTPLHLVCKKISHESLRILKPTLHPRDASSFAPKIEIHALSLTTLDPVFKALDFVLEIILKERCVERARTPTNIPSPSSSSPDPVESPFKPTHLQLLTNFARHAAHFLSQPRQSGSSSIFIDRLSNCNSAANLAARKELARDLGNLWTTKLARYIPFGKGRGEGGEMSYLYWSVGSGGEVERARVVEGRVCQTPEKEVERRVE